MMLRFKQFSLQESKNNYSILQHLQDFEAYLSRYETELYSIIEDSSDTHLFIERCQHLISNLSGDSSTIYNHWKNLTRDDKYNYSLNILSDEIEAIQLDILNLSSQFREVINFNVEPEEFSPQLETLVKTILNNFHHILEHLQKTT